MIEQGLTELCLATTQIIAADSVEPRAIPRHLPSAAAHMLRTKARYKQSRPVPQRQTSKLSQADKHRLDATLNGQVKRLSHIRFHRSDAITHVETLVKLQILFCTATD